MSALRELLAVFDIKVDDKELKEADGKSEEFAKKLGKTAATVAAASGVEKLFEFVKTQVEVNAHLEDLSRRLNVSATDIRTFGLVAQSAGVDLDSAASALGHLERTLGKGGTGKAAKEMGALGIATKDAHGQTLPMTELLGNIAEKLGEVTDQNQRAAMASALFGRTVGTSLLPILSKGREAFDEAMNDAEKL